MHKTNKHSPLRRRALNLIFFLGLVSLFGDITYEGARSVNGPYLQVLAANAATVGIIAGIGELLGYGLRLLSGYLSDQTKSYWLFTFVGYAMLICVPLLSLAGTWQIAVVLIIIERIGKAIRSPARDAILSQASSQVGTGFGFGLHEAMDQIGAVVGPLIFTLQFTLSGARQMGMSEYQKGYVILWVPLLLALLFLMIAYLYVPRPATLNSLKENVKLSDTLSPVFWLYPLFTFFATAGFCNFMLIAFHFKSQNALQDSHIPSLYAVAMGIDAVAALAVGKKYDLLKKKDDRKHAGLDLLILIPTISLVLPLLVFADNFIFILTGVCLWGMVMGCQETIMRSAIADITPLEKRGSGYGLFNTTYGLGALLGSSLLGFLYDHSVSSLTVAVILLESLAVVTFFLLKRTAGKGLYY